MSFTISCPSCGLKGQVPDGFKAPGVECPRCKTYVPMPNGGPAAGPSAPASPAASGPQFNPVDAFFARVGSPSRPPSAGALPGPPPPPPAPPRAAAAPDSSLPVNPQAEQEWLKEERQRLEGYMGKQFGVLRQQREQFDRWRSEIEQALITREQELNRQTKLITSRGSELDQRENDLNIKASQLDSIQEELPVAEAKLRKMQENLQQMEREADAQRAARGKFGQEALQAQKNAQQAKAEHERLQAEIAKQKAAHQEEETKLRGRQQ